jgi:hypothetical protein
VSSFEQQVEQDLAWREAEMGSLKLLLASAPTGTDRHRALLRACSAMLYAHYEGFCKFCWTLLLDTIQAGAHIRRDLAEPIARRAMAPIFKRLRGDTSDVNIWRFGLIDFQSELAEKARFADEIDTQSNLWPDLAQRINDSVGLSCPTFGSNAAELSQLVGRRNKIAHGEKLEIADLKQFRTFEHVAWLAMHDLAVAVVECLQNKSYLRAVAGPVAATAATP